MNKLLKLLILPFLLLSVIPSQVMASQSKTPDINNPDVVEAFIDGMVIPQMKKEHSPSGVVTLMKDNVIVFAKGYGYQDVEKKIPVDPATTLFRPGSISKLFTWVSVMQLVEQGNLDLDSDVNQYLKTFQIEDTWPGQPVTLRDIMSHTAGFEDGGYGYLIIEGAERIIPLANSLATHIPVRVNPPGEHTSYSNWATALAGLIVANVSGIEFNEYVQQNIFDVLGMKSSTFVEPLPAELDSNMAKAYSWEEGQYIEQPYEIIANFGPAGSAALTSYDMAKFAKAILGGGEFITSDGAHARILKAETMRQMLSSLYTHDSRTRGMAHGFLQYGFNGVDIIGHDGGTTRFVSHFGLSSENNMMLFTSFSGPGGRTIHKVLYRTFYDYFFQPELKNISPDSDFAGRAARFVGIYHTWRANFTQIEAILALVSEAKISAMPDNTILYLDRRFIEADKNLFRQVDGDSRIVFQENDLGEITGFISDGLAISQMYKAPFYRTQSFTLFIVVLSIFVFIAVLLRRAYQGAIYKALPQNEKAAFRASLILASSNLTFLALVVLSLATAHNLVSELPWLLKFSLIFPIIILPVTIYHIYQSTIIWRDNLGGVWAKIRFSIVSLCGAMMTWFYYYWNFIGFNYFS